uniref:Uncharacterized protein n=1 Tax=Rhizophora mucronata TaxID=61149 RepID=A0A2P2QP24_RHIMU
MSLIAEEIPKYHQTSRVNGSVERNT